MRARRRNPRARRPRRKRRVYRSFDRSQRGGMASDCRAARGRYVNSIVDSVIDSTLYRSSTVSPAVAMMTSSPFKRRTVGCFCLSIWPKYRNGKAGGGGGFAGAAGAAGGTGPGGGAIGAVTGGRARKSGAVTPVRLGQGLFQSHPRLLAHRHRLPLPPPA